MTRLQKGEHPFKLSRTSKNGGPFSNVGIIMNVNNHDLRRRLHFIFGFVKQSYSFFCQYCRFRSLLTLVVHGFAFFSLFFTIMPLPISWLLLQLRPWATPSIGALQDVFDRGLAVLYFRFWPRAHYLWHIQTRATINREERP